MPGSIRRQITSRVETAALVRGDLHRRQMATRLTFPGFHGIGESDMPAAGEDSRSRTNLWKKTNEQQLFNELETEYGFSPAKSRSLVQFIHAFVDNNYGNLRNDNHSIYHAVSSDEPPGKPMTKQIRVPVIRTLSQPTLHPTRPKKRRAKLELYIYVDTDLSV
jgi:hypothetical protein